MYLKLLKTALVDALAGTFNANYPEPDFQGINVSMEFPVAPQHYPGVWVDYDDSAPLQIAGVHHREVSAPDTSGNTHSITRWRFSGTASFTCVALSSLECARLYDEMVRIMAFGNGTDVTPVSAFRTSIEANQFIAMNFNFDNIQPRGTSAAPGTPWGTDDIIYERTIDMDLIGEFVSGGATASLLPLSAINLYAESPPGTWEPSTPTTDGWM